MNSYIIVTTDNDICLRQIKRIKVEAETEAIRLAISKPEALPFVSMILGPAKIIGKENDSVYCNNEKCN